MPPTSVSSEAIEILDNVPFVVYADFDVDGKLMRKLYVRHDIARRSHDDSTPP